MQTREVGGSWVVGGWRLEREMEARRPGGQACCHLPSGCDKRLDGRKAVPTQ